MEPQSRQLIQKLWNYCNLLRDDGLSYGDYLEQLTFLLFLKMSYEQTELFPDRPPAIPAKYNWKNLISKEGDALEQHYSETLSALGQKKGMLSLIFRKAQNKIHDPAKLRRLIVDLIDRERWLGLSGDSDCPSTNPGCCHRGDDAPRVAQWCLHRRTCVRIPPAD